MTRSSHPTFAPDAPPRTFPVDTNSARLNAATAHLDATAWHMVRAALLGALMSEVDAETFDSCLAMAMDIGGAA